MSLFLSLECHTLSLECRLPYSSHTHYVLFKGTLKAGCFLVCGTSSAKVKAIYDEHGKKLREAGPGTAVEVSGWKVNFFACNLFYRIIATSKTATHSMNLIAE